MSLSSKGQGYDTIYLKPNQTLVSFDTIYFGNQDSIVLLHDSVKYVVTRSFTTKMGLLQDYYKSIFIKDTTGNYNKSLEEFAKATHFFDPYEGKIIRNVKIKQVDMFEGSVIDTSQVSITGFGKSVNDGLNGTRKWIIRQNIRFEKNSALIPSLLSENERLIRNLPYIEDAKIYIKPDSVYIDSVDIIIVTKDKFPIGITGSYYSINRFTIQPYTKNFLGFGHTLQPSIFYDTKGTPTIAFGGEYVIPNFSGWFVKTKIDFENTHRRERYRVNITKPYITNDIKYGGGVEYYRLSTQENVRNYFLPDSVLDTLQRYSMDYANLWIARSFFVDPGNYTKFINLTIRGFYENYLTHPKIKVDSNYRFHDKNGFLVRLSYHKSNYYKTSRLLGYGITEDVPFGYGIQLLTGYMFNNYYKRIYAGFNASWTQYINKFGYLAYQVGAGMFFNQGKPEDIKLGSRILYFSPYTDWGRFGIRHFISPKGYSVINPRYLTFQDFDKSIRQLNEPTAFGQSMLVVRYEPYFFTPYQVLGFKLSVSVFSDVGWLTSDAYWSGNWKTYGVFGAGFHLKNESLTFPTLSFNFGYYPNWGLDKNEFQFFADFKDRELFKNEAISEPEFYFDY